MGYDMINSREISLQFTVEPPVDRMHLVNSNSFQGKTQNNKDFVPTGISFLFGGLFPLEYRGFC